MLHVGYRKSLHINDKEIFVLLQEKVFLQSTNFPLPLIKMLCAVYYDLSPLTLIMFAKGFDCPMNFHAQGAMIFFWQNSNSYVEILSIGSVGLFIKSPY